MVDILAKALITAGIILLYISSDCYLQDLETSAQKT
jgi:hypothetical protein